MVVLPGVERFSNFAEQEAAAAAEVLEDAGAGAAAEKFLAEGGVKGRVNAVGNEDEVDVAVGEERAGLVGVGAADGVIGWGFVLIDKAKDDFENFRVPADDQDINRMAC